MNRSLVLVVSSLVVLAALGQACGGGSHGRDGGGGGGGTLGGGAGGGAGGGSAGGGAAGGGRGGGGAAGGAGGGSAGGTGGGAAGGSGGGSAPDIQVTFAASCGTFVPCGGALPGTWYYIGTCVQNSVFNSIVEGCGGPTQTQLTNKMGHVAGTISFTGTTASRSVIGSVSFTYTTTNSTCVAGCAFLGRGFPGASGSCAVSNGACVCDMAVDINDTSVGEDYSVSGNVMTLTDGGRTFDYCVDNLQLQYKETTPSSSNVLNQDPGLETLIKQ